MTIPLLINECSHFDEIKTRLTSPEVCAGQPQRLYPQGGLTAAWKHSCFSQGINANQELHNFWMNTNVQIVTYSL